LSSILAQKGHFTREILLGFGQSNFLQGLKPIRFGAFTPGPFEAQGKLKPRPPEEKEHFSGKGGRNKIKPKSTVPSFLRASKSDFATSQTQEPV
jgi:hypothetical protein